LSVIVASKPRIVIENWPNCIVQGYRGSASAAEDDAVHGAAHPAHIELL
jgi:hypothetical protein